MNIPCQNSMKRLIIKNKQEIGITYEYCELMKPDHVKIKMIACGVCGTDKHFYFESENHPVVYWGHEVIGIIIECGRDVSTEYINKYVVTKTTTPCKRCYYCKNNQMEKCQKFSRYKYNGFSEYIVLPANLAVILPIDDFKMEYILTEPLYVALDIVSKVLLDKKCNILVSGLGTIGLLTLFLLKESGSENIVGYNRSKYEWIDKKIGDWGIDKIYHDTSKINDKYDVIINTAPYYTIPDFIPKLKFGGILIFNGIHSTQNVLLDLHTVHFNKISLIPSFPHPQGDFQESINIITKHIEDLGWLITNRAMINEADGLFANFGNKKSSILKAIIVNDENFIQQ